LDQSNKIVSEVQEYIKDYADRMDRLRTLKSSIEVGIKTCKEGLDKSSKIMDTLLKLKPIRQNLEENITFNEQEIAKYNSMIDKNKNKKRDLLNAIETFEESIKKYDGKIKYYKEALEDSQYLANCISNRNYPDHFPELYKGWEKTFDKEWKKKGFDEFERKFADEYLDELNEEIRTYNEKIDSNEDKKDKAEENFYESKELSTKSENLNEECNDKIEECRERIEVNRENLEKVIRNIKNLQDEHERLKLGL